MSHATHTNAALTPRARLRLARLIVDHGWAPARAAERYDVSWRTAKKWADRYRDEGPNGMFDRSSAPHNQPNHSAIAKSAPITRNNLAGHHTWGRELGELRGQLVRPKRRTVPGQDKAGASLIRWYQFVSPDSTVVPAEGHLGSIHDGVIRSRVR